ncbi:MAG: ABC transporter permease [Dehalococcoidales bacterium]|jgi:ABC-type dipeptide/oligopeptide/nickel transport system permease subunit
MADKTVVNSPALDAGGGDTLPPRHSEWHRMSRVFFGRKLYLIGFIIVVIIIITAIFAPLLAPYDPIKNDLPHKLEGPSASHLLGTDQNGRDILSRIIYGTRISLLIGFSAVFASAFIGMLMGLTAAYFGGWVFAVIMRITDALMALPSIILVLLIAGLVGGGTLVVIFALGFGGIAGMCRMMCGQALSVKQNDYVLAGQALGMSNWRIMMSQIFPNAFPPLMVGLTMGIGGVVLGEAGLSFLGIGVPAPAPSWGGMVMDGQRFLLNNPLLSLAPGVAIMLLVFGFNMVGDGIRDAVDPKLRGVI